MLSTSCVSMVCLWWVLAALHLALGAEHLVAVRPRHYDLALLYDIDPASNFSFFGKVDILFSAEIFTSSIVLHAEKFKILDSATMSKNGSVVGTEVTRTKYADGIYTVYLSEAVEKGENYTISVAFYGNLNERVAGAYTSSYFDKETNKTEYLVATKFRSIWARQAFPCFDEPALKATFRISIGHHRNYSALSNMPQLSELKSDWPSDKIFESMKNKQDQFVWSRFDTSPPMSTHVAAWVVSKFTHLKKMSGIEISIWTRPAVIDQAKYALDNGLKMMEKYNEWFGIPYPLPKLDIVAIPGAGHHAFEGWGLIQNEERVLLHDDTRLPLNKETVSHAIADNMVHQWFGNLVTMASWSDQWLFECFATYIAALNLAAAEPEWDFEDNLAGVHMISVFKQDPSRPSSVTSDGFKQVVSFQTGYVLIRMLGKALGEQHFRQGIKKYLLTYSYNNTGEGELWEELTLADKDAPNRHITLRFIMDTWTSRPGYPVVNVTREYAKGQYLSIRQLVTPSFSDSSYWWVPLRVQCQNAPFNTSAPVDWIAVHHTRELVSEYQHTSDKNQWVLLNTDMIAPYRVDYDARNWELLGRMLRSSNFEAIPVLNRAQLISDSFELAWIGQLNYGIPLQLVKYLTRERRYLPFKVALDAMIRMEGMFMRGPDYGLFLDFIRELITEAYNEVGSDGEVKSSVERSKLQMLLSKWACRVELGTCQEKAIDLFQEWMDQKPGDGSNPIHRGLRPTVYCTAIARGNVKHWNFLQAMQNSSDDTESAVILRALACSEEVWVLSRYLEWAITPHSSVRSQDAAAVIEAVVRSKSGFLVAKDFIYNRIEDISHMHECDRGLILKALASQFTTQHDVNEFQGWHKKNERFLTGLEEQVAEADAEAKKNMDWFKKSRTHVLEIMQDNLPMNTSQFEWRGYGNHHDNIIISEPDILREHSSKDASCRICTTIHLIVLSLLITITTNIQ